MTAGVKIKEIFISNYRSFAPRDRKLGANHTPLSNINILVGPNGTGKTNFLNAIRDCIDWKTFNSQGTYTIELNYNDRCKPIEINLSVDAADGVRTARLFREASLGDSQPEDIRDPDPKQDDFFQQWIFPLGFPRRFSEIDDLNQNKDDQSYELIKQNWDKIREDASRINLKLNDIPRPPGSNPGRERDGFFFDILDEHGVPIIEGSDGKANFLFLIIRIRTRRKGSVLLIEEPDVGMHPGLQKQFLDYIKLLAQKENYQFLITTHSPYLMNLTALDNNVAVFRFSIDSNGYSQLTRVSQKIDNWHALLDLGHVPSDVLHPNGVIWVEGPSDLIYISSWLKLLAPDLTRGIDYEIMWYGGSNIAHLNARCWESTNVQSKLIQLFQLNPNWAFVVDSDAHQKNIAGGFQQQKEEMIKECESQGKFWWKVDPCIEECVKEFMRWKEYPKNRKTEYAHKYEEKISDFDKSKIRQHLSAEVNKKINELIETIQTWV